MNNSITLAIHGRVQQGTNENLDKVIAFNYEGVETYIAFNYEGVETLIETES